MIDGPCSSTTRYIHYGGELNFVLQYVSKLESHTSPSCWVTLEKSMPVMSAIIWNICYQGIWTTVICDLDQSLRCEMIGVAILLPCANLRCHRQQRRLPTGGESTKPMLSAIFQNPGITFSFRRRYSHFWKKNWAWRTEDPSCIALLLFHLLLQRFYLQGLGFFHYKTCGTSCRLKWTVPIGTFDYKIFACLPNVFHAVLTVFVLHCLYLKSIKVLVWSAWEK